MRITLCSIVLLACYLAAVSCLGRERCGGQLYYDSESISCRPCPIHSTYDNGVCVCSDDFELINNRCVLRDGRAPRPDSGMADCSEYCNFLQVCVADNPLAQAAVRGVVEGLHADEPVECEVNCINALGTTANNDPVLACIVALRPDANCERDDTAAGLRAALDVFETCCGQASDNALCSELCTVARLDPIVVQQVAFCE